MVIGRGMCQPTHIWSRFVDRLDASFPSPVENSGALRSKRLS